MFMHILFTRFPLESAMGGAEIQTLSLMEGLIERGHAVSFAGSCPVLLAECAKRNIPCTEVQIGPPPVTMWGAVSFSWRKNAMKRKLKEMLTSHGSHLTAVVMLSLSEKLLLTDIAAARGIKTLWVEHDRVGRWLAGNPWLPKLLKQSAYATTVTVSELSRQIYLKLGWNARSTIAIPNGINPDRFDDAIPDAVRARRRLALSAQGLHLGCIARLSPEKGVDILIEAMAAAPKDVTLEIVGDGPEKRSLEIMVRKLRLNDRVTFMPYESNVAKVYERIDALVLPSRDNDPFGLVAAEAMLCGLPVIVTDACGIADYLEDGKDALIAKAASPASLTEAIKKLQSSSSKLAASGRSTALEKFSMKTMVEKYENVLTA